MGGYLPGRFCPADAPRNPPLNASSRRSLKSSVVSGAPEAAAEAVPTHTISANTAAPRPGNWCEWVRGEGYGFPVWGEDTGFLYLMCGMRGQGRLRSFAFTLRGGVPPLRRPNNDWHRRLEDGAPASRNRSRRSHVLNS